MIGLIVGKFYPPHKGHLSLIRYAERCVDRLYIVVGAKEGESISPAIRVSLLKYFTSLNTIVLNIPDNNPKNVPAYSDDPRFWSIWKDNLLENLPEKPDILIGSEDYVPRLAKEMDISYTHLNRAHSDVAISGTLIRENPKKYWDFMPLLVQRYYQKLLDKAE